MKNKNPLYVVKGKTVLEAQGVADMLIKKFNLEPAMDLLVKFLNFLLAQVQDYPTFLMVKKVVDEVMGKVNTLVGIFHKA